MRTWKDTEREYDVRSWRVKGPRQRLAPFRSFARLRFRVLNELAKRGAPRLAGWIRLPTSSSTPMSGDRTIGRSNFRASAAGGDGGTRVIGRTRWAPDEARARLEVMRNRQFRIPAFESWIVYLTAWLDKRREGERAVIAVRRLEDSGGSGSDFSGGMMRCDVGG